MKVLVLGGTGFIGGQVTARLLQKRHDVMVFHRGSQNLKSYPGVAILTGERNNLSAFADDIHRFAPDVVVDVIGYSRHDAQELVATFKNSPARLVVLSSVDVYRNRTGFFGITEAPPYPLPLSEDSPLRTRFYPYADRTKTFDPETTYEKIHVEETVRSGLPGRVTILRLAAVYGPGDKQHRTWPYLKRMLDNRPFILVERNQAKWQWTRGYVENIAAAVVVAVLTDTARNQIYNVGEMVAPNELEWISRIAKITGWKGHIIELPNDALPPHLRTTFNWSYGFGLSCQKMRTALGFTDPVDLEIAMRRTIEWESLNPPTIGDAKMFDYTAEDDAA